jgi:hypothetical protein
MRARSLALLSLLSSSPLLPGQVPAQPRADAAPFDVDAAFTAAQPPPAEALWTLIPWRHSLTDALAEAKARKRPVYLFVNDGDVESARC